MPYIKIGEGQCFGLMDLSACLIKDGFELDQLQENKQSLKRQFTVRAVDRCFSFSFSLEHLVKMKNEFGEYFNELTNNSEKRLRNAI